MVCRILLIVKSPRPNGAQEVAPMKYFRLQKRTIIFIGASSDEEIYLICVCVCAIVSNEAPQCFPLPSLCAYSECRSASQKCNREGGGCKNLDK